MKTEATVRRSSSKWVVLKSRNIHRKTPELESLFNKAAGLKVIIEFKVNPVIVVKFLWTALAYRKSGTQDPVPRALHLRPWSHRQDSGPRTLTWDPEPGTDKQDLELGTFTRDLIPGTVYVRSYSWNKYVGPLRQPIFFIRGRCFLYCFIFNL